MRLLLTAAAILALVGCAKPATCVNPDREERYVAACERTASEEFCRCTYVEFAKSHSCAGLNSAGVGLGSRTAAFVACRGVE